MIKIVSASDFKRPDIKAQAEDVSKKVAKIIDDVREKGDEAVRKYEQKFDGVELSALEVSREEIDEALNIVGSEYVGILERSA